MTIADHGNGVCEQMIIISLVLGLNFMFLLIFEKCFSIY